MKNKERFKCSYVPRSLFYAREAAKKEIFSIGPATKALPPSSLMATLKKQKNRASKKVIFLSGPAFNPTPLF